MLLDKLINNAKSGALPLHMPGHKRNVSLLGDTLPYALDITEIHGFDDLHDMSGVLRDTAQLAASLYGAAAAFPMVNGSTGGILAAIRAAATDKTGGNIIMSRFSHKSVYNAAELCRLTPVYITQTHCGDSISADTVKSALQATPNTRCLVITSPTYEGAVNDIAAISQITHKHNVPLIVDAAHGAHLGFSDFFPQNATRLGADVEIVSLHKTLPALTQSSLLLANHNSLITPAALKQQLRVFQTSSPSYILLASIDRCLHLLRDKGAELFRAYADNLSWFYEHTRGLHTLTVAHHSDYSAYDRSKLIINTSNSSITGNTLHSRLRTQFNLELEMATPEYALAMTSICDTRDTFERLAAALYTIDAQLKPENRNPPEPYTLPKQHLPPHEARLLTGELKPLHRATGHISLEYVWSYPPGIPLLAPGEIIDEALLQYISWLENAGIKLHSDSGTLPQILCVAE